ncbi:MAG: hypothetical protein ACREMA_01245 [Longimicrobiales bacterium]
MKERREEKSQYEYPIFGINWTAGIGRPAGIYWLNGSTRFAGHGSPAEEYLIELGAILVGTLRFDSDPLERTHPGRPVEAVQAWRLVQFSAR